MDFNLGREQRVQQVVGERHVRGERGVAHHLPLLPFRLRQQGQRLYVTIGIRHNPSQQLFQMADNTRDRVDFKEVRIVAQKTRKMLPVGHAQIQIELTFQLSQLQG